MKSALLAALRLSLAIAAGGASAAPAPVVQLPPAAVSKSLEAHRPQLRPARYAVPVAAPITLASGAWFAGAAGESVWRLNLQSSEARSLGLHFQDLVLPAGAALTVTGSGGAVREGPYRQGGDLWVPPLSGDTIEIAIALPADRVPELALGTVTAFHGFADWLQPAPKVAGSCNVDITCAEASDWTTESGAAARITVGNQFFCSGQLLNNVRQDRRRLFLTASHCGIDGNGGTAESVAFYFNYTGACGSAGTDPAPAATFQGSRKLAGDVQSDFALVLITDGRELPANAYFAGWDATGTGGDSGASIHHPDGDEQKISFFDTALVQDTADIGSGCPIDAWRVRWSSGTTEGGSSGGGLWNSDRRVVGQLSGGTASCDNPEGFDYFGRLDRGWTASARAEGQLKAHLDPDNTCIAEIPGLDASSAAVAFDPADPARVKKCSGPASTCRTGPGTSRPTGAVGLLQPALLGLLLLGALARRR